MYSLSVNMLLCIFLFSSLFSVCERLFGSEINSMEIGQIIPIPDEIILKSYLPNLIIHSVGSGSNLNRGIVIDDGSIVCQTCKNGSCWHVHVFNNYEGNDENANNDVPIDDVVRFFIYFYIFTQIL